MNEAAPRLPEEFLAELHNDTGITSMYIIYIYPIFYIVAGQLCR